ncbi:MAG: hypothetical protein RL639_1893, partial [Verrucomicrobiota bacterium]
MPHRPNDAHRPEAPKTSRKEKLRGDFQRARDVSPLA